jgi:hypothetical protein
MKNNRTSSRPERQPGPAQTPIRKSVLILTTMMALVTVALVVFFSPHRQEPSTDPAGEAGYVPESVTNGGSTSERGPSIRRIRSQQGPQLDVAPLASNSPEPRPPVDASELVKRLNEINLQPGELTPDKANEWKQDLVELIEQGRAAVPALREFFQRNEDLRFDANSGTNLLGESTLRTAFMKVLFDIPAPENVELQIEVLRNTTDPDEIALLARQLELQEPGEHREAILNAASAALERARNGELPGRDTDQLVKLIKSHRTGGTK